MPEVKQHQQQQTCPTSVRVEFAVNVNRASDFSKIDEALKGKGYVKLVATDAEAKTVQLELKSQTGDDRCNAASQLGLDVQTLQDYLEKQTGFITVVKGLGELSSAVAELRPPPPLPRSQPQASTIQGQVMGLVRLSQLSGGQCYVDALVDGLPPHGTHSLAFHQYGDLSGDNYESIGPPLLEVTRKSMVDDSNSDGNNKLSISKIISNCDVISMIGKSAAITKHESSPSSGGRESILSAGVIARASIIDANKKQVCSCSGKTLWEERLEKKEERKSLN